MTKPTGDQPKMTRKQINTSLQFEIAKQAEIEREKLALEWVGPQCKCRKPGDVTLVDGEEYEVVSLIRDAGCPEHGLECDFVANPHEKASRGGKRL